LRPRNVGTKTARRRTRRANCSSADRYISMTEPERMPLQPTGPENPSSRPVGICRKGCRPPERQCWRDCRCLTFPRLSQRKETARVRLADAAAVTAGDLHWHRRLAMPIQSQYRRFRTVPACAVERQLAWLACRRPRDLLERGLYFARDPVLGRKLEAEHAATPRSRPAAAKPTSIFTIVELRSPDMWRQNCHMVGQGMRCREDDYVRICRFSRSVMLTAELPDVLQPSVRRAFKSGSSAAKLNGSKEERLGRRMWSKRPVGGPCLVLFLTISARGRLVSPAAAAGNSSEIQANPSRLTNSATSRWPIRPGSPRQPRNRPHNRRSGVAWTARANMDAVVSNGTAGLGWQISAVGYEARDGGQGGPASRNSPASMSRHRIAAIHRGACREVAALNRLRRHHFEDIKGRSE